MRKLLTLAVVLAVCLVPLVAWGWWDPFPKVYDGPFPKDPAHEVDTWKLEKGTWVWIAGPGKEILTAEARCFAQNPDQGSCNKQNWVIDFTNHASVAQWVNWTISGTRWDWRIRKPGTYAADCITATVQSNNHVNIYYDGFGKLVRDASGPGGTPPDEIDVWYALGGMIPPAPGSSDWIAAADLNNHDDGIMDTVALHEGIQFKLWNKIKVEECDSSSEYEDTATITLMLTNMKNWIDPSSGNFKPFVVIPE